MRTSLVILFKPQSNFSNIKQLLDTWASFGCVLVARHPRACTFGESKIPCRLRESLGGFLEYHINNSALKVSLK